LAHDLRIGGSIGRRRGYRSAYATWDIDGQWNYERGRAWAVSAPRSVELRRNGKLSPAAIRGFLKAFFKRAG
jgi:hypothetical protein